MHLRKRCQTKFIIAALMSCLILFSEFVAAILIFKMPDKQRTILEVIFRILMLENIGIDTKITLLGALEVLHAKTLDSVDIIMKRAATRLKTPDR